MLVEPLVSTPWPGIVLWTVLYCSDYLLTLAGARLYRQGVSEIIVLEGSYELTPTFQRDIDALRLISPRFLICLPVTDVLLWLLWRSDESYTYVFVLGMLVCIELMIHARHARNLLLFRAVARGRGIRGRIEYAREHILTQSSLELLSFSLVFAMLFAFTGSAFVAGGSVGCAAIAGSHWTLARRQRALGSGATHP